MLYEARSDETPIILDISKRQWLICKLCNNIWEDYGLECCFKCSSISILDKKGNEHIPHFPAKSC